MEIASPAQYEAWNSGELPPVESVRDGLWSIPVPIPNSSLRYTLAYAFESPGGVSIVDAGWNAGVAWQGLVDGLAVAGFKPGHVRAMIATHVHTDHYGLADRIRRASGARIALHPADAATISGGKDGLTPDALSSAQRELSRRIGTPVTDRAGPGKDRRDKKRRDPDGLGGDTRRPDHAQRNEEERQAQQHAEQTQPDVLVEDGDRVDLPGWNLRAIWTPGHSPGHVCYYEESLGLLLAGDHVLPRITPTVSMHPRQRVNPLGDYLASLAAIGVLPATEVLPAHQYRFHGLRARVDELAAHHQAKLAQIEAVVGSRPGVTCWEISERLDWARPFATLPPKLKRAAARETLAHLVLLQLRGRLRGDDGPTERWFADPARPEPQRSSAVPGLPAAQAAATERS